MALLRKGLVIACLASCWGASCLAQEAGAGSDPPRLDLSKLGLHRPETELLSVLPPCPRELAVKLNRAQKASEDGAFAEALELIEQLRLEAEGKDYFIGASADSNTHRGLQTEMEQVLAGIARQHPELLDTRWGARAASQLAEAMKSRDVAALESVARSYMGVEAGQQAAILLARLWFDNGRPALAASWLRTLKQYASARKYEPEVTLLQAASLFASGASVEEVNLVLADLPKIAAGPPLELGGIAAPLIDGTQTPAQWLARFMPQGFRAAALEGWMEVRGGQDRNGGVDSVVLGNRLVWRLPVVDDPERRELLAEIDAYYREQDKTVWPSTSALLIDQVLVARTLDRVYGIDPQTGKRLWWYPHHPFESVLEEELDDTSWSRKAHQLVWRDALFGRMSSDGRRVYFLSGGASEEPPAANDAPFIINRNVNNPNPVSNQLVALDVAAEGKLAFILSGESTSDPDLQGVFFLGPPLAVRGTLYCLAEKNADVRLLALDADTGRLEWWINIANVSNTTLRGNLDRRYAGLTPTFLAGVLVCPTSAGVITAIDVQKRSLLWAYQYPIPAGAGANAIAQQRALVIMQANGRTVYSGAQTEEREWMDSSLVTSGRHVLATPIVSDELYCIDLHTGDLKWKKPRRGMSYVGCVHRDVVFLVGEHRVTGLKLSDGEPAWPDTRYVAFPAGGNPSGLGFRSGDQYVVPTTDGEINVFDIQTGRVVQRISAPSVPGNLTPCKDGVISQSPVSLQFLTAPNTVR